MKNEQDHLPSPSPRLSNVCLTHLPFNPPHPRLHIYSPKCRQLGALPPLTPYRPTSTLMLSFNRHPISNT